MISYERTRDIRGDKLREYQEARLHRQDESIGRLLSISAEMDGGTASSNSAVGSYLVFDGTLYRATTAIANGEEIIPGINVTATTVMAELIALTQ